MLEAGANAVPMAPPSLANATGPRLVTPGDPTKVAATLDELNVTGSTTSSDAELPLVFMSCVPSGARARRELPPVPTVSELVFHVVHDTNVYRSRRLLASMR